MPTPVPADAEIEPILPIYKDAVLGGILLLAAFLLFWSLDDRLLWQDEAETACLARNILRFGVPIGDDGTNLISQEAGKEFIESSWLPRYLWRWSPWLQFYLAAGSFAVLGESTFTARLPFVLLGFLTIPCTYLLTRRAFGSLAAARLSALFLATSVPFLLHARQARWYAPSYLLVACLFLSLLALARGKRFSLLAFVVSAVLLFYTQYMITIGLLLAILVSAPLLQLRRAFLIELAKAYALVALFTLPGVWFFAILAKKGDGLDMQDILDYGKLYMGYLFTFFVPLPVLALVFLPVPIRSSWWSAGWLRPALFFTLATILFIVYLSLAPWQMFRYLSVIFPITALLTGFAVARVWALNRWVGALLALILIGTNAVHLVPLALYGWPGTTVNDAYAPDWLGGRISSQLVSFCRESSEPLNPPEAAAIAYIREHGRPGDVVVATYGDLVLQFYLKTKVAGGLQGRDLPEDPDWIVYRGFTMVTDLDVRKDGWVKLMLDKNLTKYEKIELCEDITIENYTDPTMHWFHQPPWDPQKPHPITLYRKKR